MMNMPGVIDGDESVHAEIAATLERGKPVTGHWSLAGVRDHRLQAYIAAGVDSCHETTSREDALAKLRAGMWVQFREGSTFRDVEALAAVITEDGVDPRHCLLVTDDVLPETIAADGHMDRVLRRAVASGIDPLVAIQMATVNGAEYFGMRHDLGSIAPGRLADILFVEDLGDFRPHRVLADGREPGELPGLRIPGPRHPSRSGSPGRSTRGRPPGRGAPATPPRCARSASRPDRVTTEHLTVELPVDRRRGSRLCRGGRREAGEHRAPRRPRHGRARLRQGTGPAARRGRELDRARQPQPARRRDERRRHALRRRAPGRGGRRDGRRRRRRDARPGRAADRGPDE